MHGGYMLYFCGSESLGMGRGKGVVVVPCSADVRSPIERCRRSPGADRPADLVCQGSSPQGSVQPDRIDHHTKVIALQNICWAASMSSRYPRRQGNVCPMRCLRSRRCLALRAIPTGQDSLTRPVQIHVCSELDIYSWSAYSNGTASVETLE